MNGYSVADYVWGGLALAFWLTGPVERASIKARLTKALRPKRAYAKYRAGIIEAQRLGRLIEANGFYYHEPSLSTADPVDAWIPVGAHFDPLYWAAFRRALERPVERGLSDAVDRRLRDMFALIEPGTRWTFLRGRSGR